MSLTTAHIAAAVRAEVARAGSSGRKVAREVGMDHGKIQRLLAGKQPLRVDELIAIADHLGIPVATLVDEPRPAVTAAS